MLQNICTAERENSDWVYNITLSGLAKKGRVLLPAMKDKEAVKVEKEVMKNRSNLIAAARDGDEEAMESLTMEDMDTYSMISQRIATEDLFSIVESYFMPYGIQCDQYSVMGQILDVQTFKNIDTGDRNSTDDGSNAIKCRWMSALTKMTFWAIQL